MFYLEIIHEANWSNDIICAVVKLVQNRANDIVRGIRDGGWSGQNEGGSIRHWLSDRVKTAACNPAATMARVMKVTAELHPGW